MNNEKFIAVDSKQNTDVQMHQLLFKLRRSLMHVTFFDNIDINKTCH